MNFLVLLLIVGIEKFSTWRRRIQKDGPWLAQLARLENRPSSERRAWLNLGLLVLLPVLVLHVVLSVLEPVAYGLLALPVHVVVLIYSLGRGGIQGGQGPFRDACRRGDTEGAYLVARRDLGIEADSAEDLMQSVRSRFVWHAYQGLFAVIFWYVLLGPAAALAYRLLALTGTHARLPALRERAVQVRHAFDWLPARALAITFGLVGDFMALSRALIGRLLDWDTPAETLVATTACSAADLRSPTLDEEGVAGLDAIGQLMMRAAIFWYVVLAVWVVFF